MMNEQLTTLLNSLNKEQKTAVEQHNGTMLVCAGAGSGKTRVIIARIAYLIHNNVPPESIIAVTFTNKAANEMKERLSALFPDLYALPYIGTFHAFCLRTLKTYQSLLGIAPFTLLDESDQRKMVHDILKRSGLDKEYRARSVIGYISHRKNSIHASDNAATANSNLEMVYETYEKEKSAAYCYDFDDLLLEIVRHLHNNTEFRQRLHSQIHHILVDEYQDTNHVQHAILKHLACENGATRAASVCVVGDEDQSIYTWRGATVHNFVNFHNEFPETRRITITQNYRSAQPILEAANTVIQNNQHRYEKALWSQKTGKDRILLAHCASHIQESQLIAHTVQHALAKGEQPAVLYRSHYQSRAIEEALVQNNIAYTIIGGTEFYQRKEIKDILAYLKLLANPYDHISWTRACNVPARKLGTKFQEQFLTTWRNEPFLTHFDVARQLQQDAGPQRKRMLDTFINVFTELSATQSASEVCNTILQRIQYIDYLQNTYEEDEAQEKQDNILELQRALSQRPEVSVQAFLEDITLMQSQHEQQDSDEKVHLMTLHAAKGLEFNTIIITGLEEGIFPSNRSRYDDDSLEEERRLLYVGLTRAQERVVMTYAQYRATFGSINDNPPSRFISEMPEHLVRHEQISWWREEDIKAYISNWFASKAPTIPKKQPTQRQSTKNTQQQPQHTPAKPQSNTQWRKQQRVWHPTFGAGTVIHVTEKSADQTYVTVQFASRVKKLDAKFISHA